MSSTQGKPGSGVTSKLNAYQAIVHLPRTLKVAGAVMHDTRVKFLPKAMFVGSLGIILAALLTPEALAEFIAVVPGIGDVIALIGIPIDGAIDWLALGVAALNLMKFFPQDIVNEHLNAAMAKGKPDGHVVDADPVR